MCEHNGQKARISQNTLYLVAAGAGLLAGYFNVAPLMIASSVISEIFINLLKLISLPIIFLSIVSTASGMENLKEVRFLGLKVVKYTLLTTIVAAFTAMLLFVALDPVRTQVHVESAGVAPTSDGLPGYFTFLIQSIPSNIIQPFANNHVIGVFFIAMGFSLALLSIPDEKRKLLHSVFSSLYATVTQITAFVIRLMPVAVFAFITLFFKDIRSGLELQSLALYLVCILAANLIQAFIVLPGLLLSRGISPVKMAKGMMPALSVAFFSKSSSAALPMAMKCAEENVKIASKVSGFAFPLCTTINMNACAAFIYITVMFVSMSSGVVYSGWELVAWVFIATLAAVGNAGVPMGCYTLSTAFLAAMGVPLQLMGVILPFYSLIDMLESSINVWSDACVAAAVDREVNQSAIQAQSVLS